MAKRNNQGKQIAYRVAQAIKGNGPWAWGRNRTKHFCDRCGHRLYAMGDTVYCDRVHNNA